MERGECETMKGFDCASPLTEQTAASFRANGYDFVCRYLVPATSAWKALTLAEAQIIQNAGLKIVSVFETTADRALGDYQAGVSDAKTAMQCAAQVGQPTGSAIYFAVDFEPTDAQIPAVLGYFAGIHDALVGYDVGVYGCYDVVNAVKAKGLVSHLWETVAWSGGYLADCQIFQYKNGPDGADYDLDRGFGFEGAWGNGPTTAPPATKLDPGVALTVINTWMAKSYDSAKAAGATDQANYYHWLANCLRDAAGLPRE